MTPPTYGSEEVRKLRETIQSLARIVRDYESALAQQDAQAVLRSTSPTDLRPYDPTEQMRWAAKQLDPALTHEQVRAMWCAMWSAAPTLPAQAEQVPVACMLPRVQNPPPDPERHKLLLARLISHAERIGELLERCQGKGWSQAESDEFTRLRDVQLPGTLLAIEHLVKRASNIETSEGVFVPRELLAKVANALGLPYEAEHTRLRSKLLEILFFAAPAQQDEQEKQS